MQCYTYPQIVVATAMLFVHMCCQVVGKLQPCHVCPIAGVEGQCMPVYLCIWLALTLLSYLSQMGIAVTW